MRALLKDCVWALSRSRAGIVERVHANVVVVAINQVGANVRERVHMRETLQPTVHARTSPRSCAGVVKRVDTDVVVVTID